MSNLPPFVYSRAFWMGVSYLLAGVLALLVLFGVVPAEWAMTPAAILAFVLMVLSWFGINPELLALVLEQRLRKTERLLEEAQILRNDFLDEKKRAKTARGK